MTDNDFRTACDVLVVRWRFAQIVEREFERAGTPPGSGLLAPTDDGTPTVQSGPVNTRDQ